ncbi:MAG TPA: carboxypeptidase-like regulatory domain-containing protein [Terracidiphilus sp.]|nr:carboxypeptidase-like regulatory domain-containing protein [Terracidiphilus sp.]
MFLPAGIWAQGSTGTISGHVADTSGASIPGATITLTNTATSGVRTTVSTNTGDYTFPAVPIGTYELKAERQGFKTATSQDLQLQVAQSMTQNFTLQIGGVEQTVRVTASGDLLQTQNTSLGTTVPTQTLAQMPVNNRNYLNLVAVSANANVISATQGQAGAREGGARANQTISVGGSRIMFDHYTLDGINNSDTDFNSYVVQPSIDAIAEMKVQTGVYPAEYGYNATQISVVSKSGTNHYHGTAFDFVRNNYADALGYCYTLPKTPCAPALPYKYNDYGFVLGGPLTIPHVFNGTNRFFFMVNDEWYSEVNFSNATLTLPNAAELGGDFSNYTGKGSTVIPIYDPSTGNPDGTGRTQFPGNNLSGHIDPISQKILQLYYAAAQNSAASSNYRFLNQGSDKHDGFNVRADFNQSQKSQWAFRFSNGLETNPNKGFTTPGGTVGSKIITKYYQYMGSNTWTISPTLVNVASFGWTNFYNSLGLYSQGTDDDVTKIGIPNLQPGLPTTWGIPNIGFTGDKWNTLFSGIGDSSDGPYVTSDPDIAINDNMTWIHGKHSIDLGFQYERQTFNELGNQFSRGNFVFQRDQTAQVTSPGTLADDTGSALASFLLGDLYSAAYAVQIAKANYKRNVEAAYFDDNFKITPKLSIQAGLRYELTPPWYDTLGTEFIVDMHTNHSPISPVVSGPEPQQNWPEYMREGNCNDAYQGINVRWVTAPPPGQSATTSNTSPVTPGPQCANGDYPNSLMQTDYVDFAPRIGFSLQATPTLIVRSGFGIYFAHDTANARFDMARNLAGRVTNVTGGGASGVNTIDWGNAVAGGGTALITPPYSFSMQYDHRTSNSEVWLLDIQKQLGTNWQIEAGYMGSKSSHLFGFRNANYSIPYGLLGTAGYYQAGQTSTTPGRQTCTASGDPTVVCGASKSILDRTPYPNYGVIQLVHDIGIANYQALSFQVNKRFSNGFNLISSYTFSKSLDDTSGIRTQSSQLFPQNDLCIACEYGPSDFDVKHRLVASFIYDLPVGPGRMWAPSSKIVNAVIGGWELTTLGTLQSGRPYNMRWADNKANTNTIAGGTYATRPNYVPGQSFLVSHPTVGVSGQWVNLAAWPEPAGGFLGNTKRNMLYGPGVQNFDMSLDKTFNMPYNEHHQFQIRLDAFNALNHTDFGTPDTNLTSGTKGQITGSALNARQLQLGARYTF